ARISSRAGSRFWSSWRPSLHPRTIPEGLTLNADGCDQWGARRATPIPAGTGLTEFGADFRARLEHGRHPERDRIVSSECSAPSAAFPALDTVHSEPRLVSWAVRDAKDVRNRTMMT